MHKYFLILLLFACCCEAELPPLLDASGECECETGFCCDGCYLYSPETVCAPQARVKLTCPSNCSKTYREELWQIFCNGISPDCVGDLILVSDEIKTCSSNTYCTMSMSFCTIQPGCN